MSWEARWFSKLICFLITLLVVRSEFVAPFDLRLKYEGKLRGWHGSSCLVLDCKVSVYSARSVIALFF